MSVILLNYVVEKWIISGFISLCKQIYTHTHVCEKYSITTDLNPSNNSQPDMWGVYFRHFGLNISDLQLEHMLCWGRVAALHHVPFYRMVAVAAEKERAVQFGTTTRQALVTTSWQAKRPPHTHRHTPPHPSFSSNHGSPPASGPNHSQLQCLHHCWPDQPGTDIGLAGGGKKQKKLECQPYDGWKEHQQLASHCCALLCLCVRARVDTCMCVLIFEQHLSSPYITVWLLYTDNVSSPQGSSRHCGHMDNPIPVVELVIKNTHGCWVTVRPPDSFGQTRLQIAQRSSFSLRPQLVVRLMPGWVVATRWAQMKGGSGPVSW